jgi:hypothetical protein
VSDIWPPTGPQKREPRLEHIRDVWVLHGIERKCVAGLYRTTFLVESRLSRYGEAPLLLIAEEAKQDLLKHGWTELPLNATRSRETHLIRDVRGNKAVPRPSPSRQVVDS